MNSLGRFGRICVIVIVIALSPMVISLTHPQAGSAQSANAQAGTPQCFGAVKILPDGSRSVIQLAVIPYRGSATRPSVPPPLTAIRREALARAFQDCKSGAFASGHFMRDVVANAAPDLRLSARANPNQRACNHRPLTDQLTYSESSLPYYAASAASGPGSTTTVRFQSYQDSWDFDCSAGEQAIDEGVVLPGDGFQVWYMYLGDGLYITQDGPPFGCSVNNVWCDFIAGANAYNITYEQVLSVDIFWTDGADILNGWCQ